MAERTEVMVDMINCITSEINNVTEAIQKAEVGSKEYEVLVKRQLDLFNQATRIEEEIGKSESSEQDRKDAITRLEFDKEKHDKEIKLREKQLDLDEKKFKFEKVIKPLSIGASLTTAGVSAWGIYNRQEKSIRQRHEEDGGMMRREDADSIKSATSATKDVFKGISGFLSKLV